ncbi:MAG TPA: glycosyltransferase [Candidatus Ruthenibacterium avium]|uniref:Glycosyltransferase n=1 Tax=Candidatus Ruthenibacterium avium TaxID=2838751 RepID=A0A9D2RZW3_9FIRM|nr:glycosyltransferase [Candidatus Ruthenibacterium avium]
MLPLVSVIIPVYNAAADLARCIESVRRQSYENLEILLVNDGSRDTSGEICRMYARVDERIRVIDKQNEGVSAARNDAIRAAKGKYLQFADSDDYMAQDAVYRMVQKAEHDDCDLVIAAYCRVRGEHQRTYAFLPETSVMSKNEFARHLMEEPASFYYGVLWNKLYRADIIRRHDIRCNTDLSWSEDFLFNLEYIRYAERFAALEYPVYYYINNEKSITHTQMDVVNVIKTKATLFQYYKELYEHLGLYEKYKPQIYRYLISVAER